MTVYLLWIAPPILIVLLAAWIGRRVPEHRLAAWRALPDARYAPLAAAVLSMAAVWCVWGSLHQVSVVHDEASYLIQAETFARGRWAMPVPPLPAFFEQYHVLVAPAFASKYPPGHAVLLVPGVWLGVPGLVPLLLTGAAAALLFALVRRVTNGWIAALTTLLWFSLGENLVFRASYMSETTSSLLWLAGWWGLLEWTETRRPRWLVIVAACVGWMVLTRPLTAAAFALPIAFVVLRWCWRTTEWRVLVRPILVGLAFLAVIPLWSAEVTGAWQVTPYTLYGAAYMPWDQIGFGLDSTPPRRAATADMAKLDAYFEPIHAAHVPANLPGILFARSKMLFVDAFHGVRMPLAAFALLALLVLPAAGWFAVAASALLLICYLAYAHPANWDVYYLEIFPLLPFLTACGLWTAWLALAERTGPITARLAGLSAALRGPAPRAAVAALLFGAVLVVAGAFDVARVRRGQQARRAYQATFAEKVTELPGARKIVFVRYAPWHQPGASLIANHADLAAAPTWFVVDRGNEDLALIARAPDRVPYLFDQEHGTFARIERVATSNPK